MAPARTRLARKQNAGLWFSVRSPKDDRLTILSEVEGLVGSPTCLPASRVLLTPLEARKEKALTGLTPPAEAAASQKWKIIYLQVLN